jgi:hypothetical protein
MTQANNIQEFKRWNIEEKITSEVYSTNTPRRRQKSLSQSEQGGGPRLSKGGGKREAMAESAP